MLKQIYLAQLCNKLEQSCPGLCSSKDMRSSEVLQRSSPAQGSSTAVLQSAAAQLFFLMQQHIFLAQYSSKRAVLLAAALPKCCSKEILQSNQAFPVLDAAIIAVSDRLTTSMIEYSAEAGILLCGNQIHVAQLCNKAVLRNAAAQLSRSIQRGPAAQPSAASLPPTPTPPHPG